MERLSDEQSANNPEMRRNFSVGHSRWLQIQKQNEKFEKNEDGIVAALKGKSSNTLSSKINNADMNSSKTHKYIMAAFFEQMKLEFKDKSQIEKTFNGYVEDNNLENRIKDWTYDDYLIKQIPEKEKDFIETYGETVMQAYIKNGLSTEEVKLRQEGGLNKLPEKKKTPGYIKFLLEISNVFSLLLWFGAILSLIGYFLAPSDMSNLWLGIVLIAVVLISAICSFLQGASSDSMIESLKKLQKAEISVKRDGIFKKINIIELVKGDVVQINLGEKIPADLRIVSGEIEVDNSALTGEIKPVKIGTHPGKELDNAMEAKNICFFSTNNKKGEAIGVVVEIGPNTFMGKIADLASSAEPEKTTLQIELDEFIKLIAIVAVSLGVLFFILGVIIKYPIITNFIFAIGIIVANVPEGLGYAVTSILALVAKKMQDKQVLVKNLQSVETLGSITCICSDKTGTLTENKMTIVHLWYDRQIKKTHESQAGMRYDGKDLDMKVYQKSDPSFKIMNFVGVCGSNEAFVDVPNDFDPFVKAKQAYEKTNKINSKKQDNEKQQDYIEDIRRSVRREWEKHINNNPQNIASIPGNASEAAMIKFFEKADFSVKELRELYPPYVYKGNKVEIPFNSDLKMSFNMRLIKEDGIEFLQVAVKGAPENLIKKCKYFLKDGQEYPIVDKFISEFKTANEAFALKGERVIGYAYKRLDPNIYTTEMDFPRSTKEKIETLIDKWNLTFVGVVAIEDPPRKGVKEAIKICHEAGVKVIMVTGDQTLTAASIANQIGIIKNLDETPEIIMKIEGLASLEEAERKSKVDLFKLGYCN